ncbi:hypothetical protein [Brevundimonas naejangsanensis]|uniref:hypothetical protein n=1 Tax=Brevundimonas naejangsanensis TaxID=588932 RepID=UPI003209A64C
MSIIDQAPSLTFFIAIAVGLALIAYALISGSDWAVLVGLVGLLLAGKSTLTLVKRFGGSDQP